MERMKINNNHQSKINILLLAAVSLFAVIQVVLLNKFSTVGIKLTSLNGQIQSLQDDNSLLTEKIASASAIATISQEAGQFGLVKTSVLISLNTPLPVAYSLQSSL